MFFDQKEWRRETDDDKKPAIVPKPKRHYYPNTLKDLIKIIRDAENEPEPKPEVKASGSHWAMSHAAVTEDFIVETHNPEVDDQGIPERLNKMNQSIFDVIPECLTSEARRFFQEQNVKPYDASSKLDHTKFSLYHVEAGTTIWELYSRLDDENDIIDKHNSEGMAAVFPEYKGPWAMETLGGAGGQTIAGAISTGTHGGDINLPPIADAVQAVHLVGPEGKQYWIERQIAPGKDLIDEDKLNQYYSNVDQEKIEVIRNEDILNAVTVSAGRMGIIYSVVLRVVRQYALHETRLKEDWSVLKSWINDPNHLRFKKNRFIHVVINPNSQVKNKKEHSCFISFRNAEKVSSAGNPPKGRKERGGLNAGKSYELESSDFLNTICNSGSPVKAALDLYIKDVKKIRDKALKIAAVSFGIMINPFPVPLSVREAAQIAFSNATGVVAITTELLFVLNLLKKKAPSGPLGATLAYIANYAAKNDEMEILRYINEYLIENALDPNKSFTALSYAVMDLTNYKDVGCRVPGDSIEVFFEHSDPNLIIFIEKVFEVVNNLSNGSPRLAFGGRIALRFMGQSQAPIAMQKFSKTCSIEIAGASEILGNEPFMKAIERHAIELNGVIHWGQRNNLSMKEVERSFNPNAPNGALYLWRKALSRLSNNGRLPTFSTKYSRERGLEVVQPLIYDFSILPEYGCENEPLVINWNAFDNPSGTTAHLEIRTTSSNGSSTYTQQPLPSLVGNNYLDVKLPAGKSDINLVVSYTFNGRTLTNSRTISVRGFSQNEPWSFNFTANCILIDGIWRWGIEFPLFSSKISNKLCVESIHCNFTDSNKWFVRTPGIPDIPFTTFQQTQNIPNRPQFNKMWTFFSDGIGCQGLTPNINISFILTCQ
ncbi:hypothetical protein [Bacillus wiedmannii]|uniref:hypothetical protein n=1 Tax=Bacillus wiedmannii TaxID=1890302 RepID=UPI002ECEB7FC|nr:hypothetical protein [Bacillus wiedmannii]